MDPTILLEQNLQRLTSILPPPDLECRGTVIKPPDDCVKNQRTVSEGFSSICTQAQNAIKVAALLASILLNALGYCGKLWLVKERQFFDEAGRRP